MSEHRDITRRILRHYREAEPEHVAAGLEWFDLAYTYCERSAWLYGVPIEHAAVALAHLSPRTTWTKNLEHLETLLSGRPQPHYVLGMTWRNAARSLSADDPLTTFGRRSLKTSNFARAILGDRNAVVVDTWVARAAGVPEDSVRAIGVYHHVADAFRRGARRVDISARDLQAVVWCSVRGTAI